MQTIWQDLRCGLRSMGKQPGFAGLAILALALGIGAATTIFSVIQNVLLDPFPYTNAERVVTFYIHDVKQSGIGGRSFFRTAEFLEYQNQSHVFEEAIGGGNEDILITTPQGTEQFSGGYVTANNFTFLGVPAVIGRGILPEDAKPGAPPVFVIGLQNVGQAAPARSFDSGSDFCSQRDSHHTRGDHAAAVHQAGRRPLASQLWNVSEHDPLTLGAVVAIVTIVGLAACYFPARRAMTVDPTIALRYE